MADLSLVKPRPAGPLAHLLDDYLANRRAQGLSQKTIASYELALQRVLLPRMERQGLSDIERLTSRDLDRLSAELLDQGGARGKLSRASAWTYMRNIKLFFEWARTELAAEGTEVRAQATLPKLGKPLVEILERDEIQRIEDAADSERDKLVVRVLADTGLRVGELVKLRLRDVVESNKQ